MHIYTYISHIHTHILHTLIYTGSDISILDITRLTSILVEDVVATLVMLGLLQPADYTYTTTATTTTNSGYNNGSSYGNSSSSVGGYNTTATSNNNMSGKEGGKMDTGPTIPAQLVPVGKYVLVCPPDVIAKAMLKFPPGQLVVRVYTLT